MEIEDELERELAGEQLEEEEEDDLCMQLALEQDAIHRPLAKVLSLPANFTFSEESSTSPNSQYYFVVMELFLVIIYKIKIVFKFSNL